MTKVLTCRSVGANCDYVIRGQSEQEVLKLAQEHGRSAHNMTEITPELLEKIRKSIRDE